MHPRRRIKMSITQPTGKTVAPVVSLRETRREQAASRKAHPAGKAVAKAAPAKAKPAAKPAEKPAAEKRVYTATGRSGQAVYRSFSTEVTHAIDVADPKASKPLPKAGQIWQMYATKEKAEAAAAKLTAAAYDVVVTTAELAK